MQRPPILYSFRRCPYAIRARMALAVAAIPCELREVKPRNKPAAMLAISSKGTVPVLQSDRGEVIDESLDVMLWALRQHDPDKWLDADRVQCKALVSENDNTFKYYLDRYKYADRFPDKPPIVYRENAEKFLRVLEENLSFNQGKGLLEARATFADVAIFPFIRQFAKVDWQWFIISEYVRLLKWLTRFETSPLFLSVMEKFTPWNDHDEPVVIDWRAN